MKRLRFSIFHVRQEQPQRSVKEILLDVNQLWIRQRQGLKHQASPSPLETLSRSCQWRIGGAHAPHN